MSKVKVESTKKGIEVHQIIDKWLFTTVVPSSIPIIILVNKKEVTYE